MTTDLEKKSDEFYDIFIENCLSFINPVNIFKSILTFSDYVTEAIFINNTLLMDMRSDKPLIFPNYFIRLDFKNRIFEIYMSKHAIDIIFNGGDNEFEIKCKIFIETNNIKEIFTYFNISEEQIIKVIYGTI